MWFLHFNHDIESYLSRQAVPFFGTLHGANFYFYAFKKLGKYLILVSLCMHWHGDEDI